MEQNEPNGQTEQTNQASQPEYNAISQEAQITSLHEAQSIALQDSESVTPQDSESVATTLGETTSVVEGDVQSAVFDESSPFVALPLPSSWQEGHYVEPINCYARLVGGASNVAPSDFAFELIFAVSGTNNPKQREWDSSAECQRIVANIRRQIEVYNKGVDYYLPGSDKTHYLYAPLSSVEIMANTTLWGIESGGNLAHKFAATGCYPPLLFSYPKGELLIYEGASGDIKELLRVSLTPVRVRFAVVEPFAERPAEVKYTIRATLGNGAAYETTIWAKYK